MNEDADRIAGIESLRRDVPPRHDLWPSIAARLRPRRRATLPMAMAASVAAVLAVGLWFRPGPADPPSPAVVATAASPATPAATVLTADARAIVKANLRMVRTAKRDLRAAISRDPEHPRLHRLLARAEQRQAALKQLL